MNIYTHTCTDRTPYTYLIGWSHHNKWYYGVRFAKNCHPSDLWKTYFTSSKYVNLFREVHGDPDIIQIRRISNDTNKARNYEHKVLRRLRVITNDKWLNKTDNKSINSDYASTNMEFKNKMRNLMFEKAKNNELWCQQPENKKELKNRLSKSSKKRAEENTLWLQTKEGKDIMSNIQLDLVYQGNHNFQTEKIRKDSAERFKKILNSP